MKKSTKRLFAALLAATSLLALTACGGGKTEAPKTDDSKTEQPAESSGSKELSVYTAFPESEVIYYFNKFEQETGIKINYVRLSAGEMLTRVEAEKDNPQATLMFGGSTDNYIAAVDKGLLEAYQSPNLDKTPSVPSAHVRRTPAPLSRNTEPHLCGLHRLRLQRRLVCRKGSGISHQLGRPAEARV